MSFESILGSQYSKNIGNGVGAKFDRFLSHIELTDAQVKDAINKHQRIRQMLHQEYYSTPYETKTSMIIGSYAKNTAIRPPRDIDLLFFLPESARTKYGYWDTQVQSKILQEVKNKLQKFFSYSIIKVDAPVVYFPFQDSNFSVEVVPAFKNSFGEIEVCYTKNGGNYSKAYPTQEMNQLTNSNKRTSGNTVRLIKMIKVWQRFCNVELDSFAIELLCQEFLNSYEHCDKTSVYFDYMTRDFFKFLKNRYSTSLTKPGEFFSNYSIGDSWKSKAERAHLRAEKAISYTRDSQISLADEEWRKIFGVLFVG